MTPTKAKRLTGKQSKVLAYMQNGGTVKENRLTGVTPVRCGVRLTMATIDSMVAQGLIEPNPKLDYAALYVRYEDQRYALTDKGRSAAERWLER